MMYAHVNIWQMNETGAIAEDAVAQELATQLIEQPGFHAYTLIRTGDQEVVAVTIFDSEALLEDALEMVAAVTRDRVEPLAAGPPERRAGEVLFHAHMVEQK